MDRLRDDTVSETRTDQLAETLHGHVFDEAPRRVPLLPSLTGDGVHPYWTTYLYFPGMTSTW